MSELHGALGDIGRIRSQLARTTEFRGYGPATMAVTGGLALVAATVQTRLLSDPQHHTSAYLALWLSTAVLGSTLAACQIVTRTRRVHSSLSQQMLRTAVEQFLPAVLAAALLTGVLVRLQPAALWMLPGLWQIFFGLGVISSCRFLPRAVLAAGAWYVLTGLVCLGLGSSAALAPWTMGLPFGLGQVLVAAALWKSSAEVDDEI